MTREDLVFEIEDFKKSIMLEIDKHIDDSEFFYGLSSIAKNIANSIRNTNSGYFIAIVESEYEYNFDRTYYPLGFMVESKALEILEKLADYKKVEPWNQVFVKEVSEELFYKFDTLAEQTEMYELICHNRSKIKEIFPNEFMNQLKSQIDKLREEVGLTRSWEFVLSRF